jgi:hypothetical protein
MSPKLSLYSSGITRRVLLATLAALAILSAPFFPVSALAEAASATDPLPSWNDGPAKQAIVKFVQATTDQSSAKFVPPPERIATFDQDGTLWVSHPMYTQVVYCLDRVPAVVKAKPELANVEPFKTVLSGDREAIAKLSTDDLFTGNAHAAATRWPDLRFKQQRSGRPRPGSSALGSVW